MSNADSSVGAELGKKGIRFTVTIVGLLLLKSLVGALPMLRNAPAIGSTFLSPLVLANAIVNTLILIAIISFGLAVSRALRVSYPRVPDLSSAVLLAVVFLAVVIAYSVCQLPVACVVISPQDAFAPQTGGAPGDFSGPLGDMVRQLGGGMSGQLGEILKNSPGATLEAYQKLAVAKLRQPPDLYGWIFLVLSIVPVVGIVVLGSRNLDAISDLLFHKAKAATAGLQPSNEGRGSEAHRGSAGTPGVPGGRELSSEDMDKLVRLKALLDQGAIAQADFDAQKKRLLQEPIVAEEPAELQRLKQLLDAGALTKEEYEAQKQRFLARL
ncbi:MAG: SHOCT domain-containing protein [Bryobacteraceae bacterium]